MEVGIMLENGLIITAVGMGVVLLFLTLLVICMNLMAKVIVIINKFMPEVTEETVPVKVNRATEDDVAVAIAVAKMNM